MFQYHTKPLQKKRGLFGEDVIGADGGSQKPVEGFNDPATTAYIQAKYPMKSEFGDAWVDRREQLDQPIQPNQFGDLLGIVGNMNGEIDFGDVKGSEQLPQQPQQPNAPTPNLLDEYPTKDADQMVQPQAAPQTETQSAPVPTQSPMELPTQSAEQNLYDSLNQSVEKQPAWKQILYQGLQVAKNMATGQDQPITWLGNDKKAADVAQKASVLEPIQRQEQYNQQKALRDAQIKTIPIDDENKKLEIKARQDALQDRLKATALTKVAGLKYFDPNNPVHKKLAEQAGINEELKGWDDRNPVTKQVAGVTYQYDRATGKFEPSNLPADESKTLTDYTVQMPNGEWRTYKVAQKDAANFATQMQALGARINATAVENEKNRALTREQNDLNRKQALSISNQRIAQANQNIELAKQRLAQADEKSKAQAQKDLEAAQLAKKRVKAYILNNPLISDNAELLEGLDDQ
jgi:hypothetical protein